MYWEAFARGIDTLGEGKVHRSSVDAQAIALLIPRQNAYEEGIVIIGCCLAQQWTVFHCHSDINSGCWFNQKLWYDYIERIREKEGCACVRFTAMTESLQCLRLPGKHILQEICWGKSLGSTLEDWRKQGWPEGGAEKLWIFSPLIFLLGTLLMC